MYYFEWLTWQTKIQKKETAENIEEFDSEHYVNHEENPPNDIENEQIEAKKSISTTPLSRGPIYQYDEHVLEIRCGLFETHRGYVTLLSISIILFICATLYSALLFTPYNPSALLNNLKKPPEKFQALPIIIYSTLTITGLFLYSKYGFHLSRLELFTSRHLLIRFNRTTRQVFLHRPSYCGGITTLPWEGITSSGSSPTINDTDAPLLLSWPPEITGTLHPELVAVGRRTNNQAELRNEWEFIRRFMESGPKDLPTSKISSYIPWPWHALRAQFEGRSYHLSNANNITRLGLILLSPTLLLFGAAHWLSLMLCWKPRWPKIIREAGFPGKPVPPFTTLADYPEYIQQRLRDNAHLWAHISGNRPENCHDKLSTLETTKDEA